MNEKEIKKVITYAISCLEVLNAIPENEPVDILDLISTLEYVICAAKQLFEKYQNLKEIIKDNFNFAKDFGVYFVYTSPVNTEKIMEVLKNE